MEHQDQFQAQDFLQVVVVEQVVQVVIQEHQFLVDQVVEEQVMKLRAL